MKIGVIIRRLSLVLWAIILVATALTYLSNPQWFTAEQVTGFLQRFQNSILFAYLGLSILRGFTLLPSTPLVIAGTMLFPGQPFTVLAVSIIGILLSSSMIYFFSEYLGFSDFFEGHKPELTHKIKAKLEHPLGFLFVALWAFFPLVPTDLVCYLAGTTKMNFIRFIAAVFVGELILCVFYVFSGNYLFNFWQ